MSNKRNHWMMDDPTKSDPEDSDFDENPVRSKRPTSSRKKPKKTQKKKQRGYNSDISESDEDDLEDEDSFAEDEIVDEEPTELTGAGRPKRKSVQKPVKYEESTDVSDEGDEPEESEPQPRRKGKLVIKLRDPRVRSRANSARPRSRQSASAEPTSASTRRSHRLAHDEQETIVALTDSGRHAQIVRPGTRSPEAETSRPRRGSKAVKAPVGSAIFEADEEEGSQEAGEQIEAHANAHQEYGGKGVRPDQHSEQAEAVAESDAGVEILHEDESMADVVNAPAEGEVEPGPEAAKLTVEDDDDDEGPIAGSRRVTRGTRALSVEKGVRSSSRQKRKTDASSDFEFNPEEPGEENISSSDSSEGSPRKGSGPRDEEGDESSNTRKSGRLARERSKNAEPVQTSDVEEQNPDEAVELEEELNELREGRRTRNQITYHERAAPKLRNRKQKVDYRILRPDLLTVEDNDPEPAPTPSRRGRGANAAWQRSLFSTHGPFGGAAGPPPVFGGPLGTGATGGVDSDSSDDERTQRPTGLGGAVGMTPTSAVMPGLLSAAPQPHGADPAQGPSGTPANLGKIKDRKALADADPLGVDQNVSFESVGGLSDQINQLKEMVSLPLLYPEIFQRFHVTPPRGVLFHGPPGTGKTLLARALAASVSSEGRKITFYMRKGADALSKWVGEAERQLRLLFDEARANQPSIIFFDEIDGLAPVRSSKQEQIHASIVSTLLALMDGMDGRGQVIVIGATNRPDSIDPALRRPGRFDREFYFPLPSTEARRSIIDIHTKEWDPPLSLDFKDQLASVTKGYGGADLRALCTEAALNAVQRRYPQIYSSNQKLKIDPSSITITAKDFMISVKKVVPSSERSASSGAAPLPRHIEPLLRKPLQEIKNVVAEVLPQKKRLTALEEAHFEEYNDADGGFQRERVEQDFEMSRIFRPRMLIRGLPGMGQHYLAAAMLNHFEGLHVQSFDLPTLLSDSTRSSEAAIIQLFTEVRRHKPSVIYIPNVDSWYRTVGPTVISTFLGLLRSLPPTEPVLLLGFLESEDELVDRAMLRDLFGFSKKNQFALERPDEPSRKIYFENVTSYIRKAPSEFPDPDNRKRRKLEELEVAPPPAPPKPPTKEEQQAAKRKDRQVLNLLKIKIQPIMDQIKLKYRKFRTGVVEDDQIRYIYEDEDPNIVSTDVPPRKLFRPFEKSYDKEGVPGLLEVASEKFFYNLNIQIIEERLSNGWYKRPKDFLTDIRRLAKDAKMCGDRDRTLKANEMLANVEVDMAMLESDPYLADCESVYLREIGRAKEKQDKRLKAIQAEGGEAALGTQGVSTTGTSEQTASGPVRLGETIPSAPTMLPVTPSRPSNDSSHLSNGYSVGPTGHTSDPHSQISHGNGSSVPSKGDGDVHMTDSDQGSVPRRSAPQDWQDPSQPSQPQWGGSTAQNPISIPSNPTAPFSQQRSQKSMLTAMPPGSIMDDFTNDASTTESGKKTSSGNNTQSTNGVGRKDGPDFTGFDSRDVPFSQGSGGVHSSQSQPTSHHSSQPPVPAFNAPNRQNPSGSIQSILNNGPTPQPQADASVPAQAASPDHHADYLIDPVFVDSIHAQFAARTSGCTLEQLEQVNSALMDSVWKQRGDWNRTKVCGKVMEVFNDIIEDIDAMQEILPASLATQ
ncbi:MAG: delta subunit of the central stalk of mitochondrial F1F0 ATP synthase, atp16 [Chaenotheca gracillima]|nr:MAG: delta subunit of the central stalk of mitochondrial F1F0 ATP synthase, atp16 [Chaenotheca gracillima]